MLFVFINKIAIYELVSLFLYSLETSCHRNVSFLVSDLTILLTYLDAAFMNERIGEITIVKKLALDQRVRTPFNCQSYLKTGHTYI